MKRGLLTGLLMLVLSAVTAMSWLFTSESGLHWSYRQAEALLAGELRLQQLSGSLNGGVTLIGVEYSDDEIELTADRVILHWNPWALLLARIDISGLEAQQLDVQLRQSDDNSSTQAETTSLPQLDLPLELRLHELEVDKLRLSRGDSPLRLEQLKLQATGRGSQVNIAAFSVRVIEVAIADNPVIELDITLAGDIDASGDYPHALRLDWKTRLPAGEIIDNSIRINGDLRSTRLTQQSRGPLQAKLTLALQDLPGQLSWQANLEVASFDTTLLDSALPVLRGSLDLSAKGDLSTAQATAQLDAESAELGPFKASLSLRSLEPSRLMDGVQVETLKLAIFDGELAAQGQLYWSPTPSWDSEVSASDINPASLLPEWPGILGARLQSQGRIEDGKLFASASIADLSGTLRGYPLSLQGEMQWRDEALAIESARLESGSTVVIANGRISGDLDLDWSLDSHDLAELYPAAQGQLIASGHLGGATGSPIIKARFNGKSLRMDDYALGSIDGDMLLDLLNWRQLELNFAARQVEFQDHRLRSIDVNANQRSIKASLVAARASAEIELAGELHDQGWRGKLIKADIDTSDFASWRLRAPVALSLTTDSSSSDPLCLLSSRQAEICASFQQREKFWDIGLDLSRFPLQMLRPWTPPELRLDGVINATGELQYSPDKPLLGKLEARLPAARASYPLQEGKPQDFDYRLVELELLLEPWQVNLTTRLTLENGDGLEGSVVLPQADILQIDLERQTMQASVNIKARNWLVLDAMIPQVEELRGALELSINASGNIVRPRLLVNGRLSDGEFYLPDVKSRVRKIALDLQSDDSERLHFSGEAMTDSGSIAIQGDTLLDPDQAWPGNISLDGEGLDLAKLLAPWIEPPLVIDGKLQASADLKFQAPDQLFGELRLSSSRGRLTYPLLIEEVEDWNYRDAFVTLTLHEQGIDASSGITIGKENSMAAEMTLPQARLLTLDPEQQAVEASAEVSFNELELIEYLLPEVDQMKGQLALDVKLSGSLAQPLMTASARMPQTSFNIPRLGLQIERVSLQGSNDEMDRFNFRLKAYSGDGHLTIKGSSTLDPVRGWPSSFIIEGQDFEVSRIPEAQVTVSPNLKITVDRRNIGIEGDLLVPYAKLQPRDISTATRVSNDSIIIGSEPPVEPRWRVSTRVRLTLGDQVTFSGFGFEGRLGGRLLLEDRPGELTTGSGEITILEGRYRAYGQRLDIDKGRLLFGGGVLDNPGLDLRAQRQVNDVTVGLTVGGRLQQPEVELFSIPAMGETDMLSYLLFGRPMETTSDSEGATMARAALALGLASGNFLANSLGDKFGLDEMHLESNDTGDQASLVVGRYLSPKMYVSYGVGLVESINSLTLRYQLADQWHLEAKSGEFQGADLLFTIER